MRDSIGMRCTSLFLRCVHCAAITFAVRVKEMESRRKIIQSANECTRNARVCVDMVHVARVLRWNRELNRLQGKPAYDKRLAQIVELDPAFVHKPQVL